ncbi:hypothetical protein AOQ84DRAFT_222348 [Glonium stellatum]|uniref:Leucine-rich repeat domain-containing protein n=1 Tax=Glonium stellatum TaxID=574774 RepID=A0A8E2FC95_9PEZI|nr:hypothetical protein AOQ84DRAFT_222348 [Glonium stellatum]
MNTDKKLPSTLLESGASRRRKPETTIDDLPDELLLEIITLAGYYGPYGYPDSYCVYVSRRWCRLALPLLYYRYSFKLSPSRFLRTIVMAPELGRYVKEITVDLNVEKDKGKGQNILASKDYQDLVTRAKSLQIPNEDEFLRKLSQNDREALLVLILSQTPNIRVFEAQATFHIPWDFPDGQLEQPLWLELISEIAEGTSVGRIHHFHTLQRIKVDLRYPVAVGQLSSLFRLPSLRTIEIRYAFVVDGESSWKYAEKSSSVENLTYTVSAIHHDALVRMILACKALKSFTYYHDEAFQILLVPLNVSPVSRALRVHSDSLEKICIRHEFDELACEFIGLLGSFQDFRRLKDLDVNFSLLVDENMPGGLQSILNILPPNLETLTLFLNFVNGPDCIRLLRELAVSILREQINASPKSLPCLRKVCVNGIKRRYRDRLDLGPLAQAFDRAGIEFKHKENDIPGAEQYAATFDPMANYGYNEEGYDEYYCNEYYDDEVGDDSYGDFNDEDEVDETNEAEYGEMAQDLNKLLQYK